MRPNALLLCPAGALFIGLLGGLPARAGETSPSSDSTLGSAPHPEAPTTPSAIINGVDATADDFPMAGGVLENIDLTIPGYGSMTYDAFICSSTLIAPDVVLLAAHCLDEDALTYGQGSADWNEVGWTRQADLTDYDGTGRTPDWPSDTVYASDWVKHPDFDIFRMRMGTAKNYDIALIFLEEPVLDVTPAYVITEEEASQIEEGAEVTIVGWGQQTATSGNQMPPAGTYAIKEMGTTVLGEVSEYEFQVGPSEDDPRKCHGDLGGPTFMNVSAESEEVMRIIGVTSHSYDSTDCESKGGVDTRVDAYLTWIEEEMVSRCEDGSRSWCEVEGLIPAPLPSVTDDEGGDADEVDGGGGGRGGKGGCSTTGGAPASIVGLGAALALLAGRRRGGSPA